MLSYNKKLTSLLLQVVCILLLDISLVEELVGACFLEEGPLEGAADQEHLLGSKGKKMENLKGNASVRGCVGRVVGMCGVCLLLGLGDHGLLVCLPLGPVVHVSCGGSIKQSSPHQLVSQGTCGMMC